MLVVIDDPTEGLDAEGAKVVWDAMRSLSKRGRTVIVFSHDANILSAAPYYMNLNSKPVPKLVQKEGVDPNSNQPFPTKGNVQKIISIPEDGS